MGRYDLNKCLMFILFFGHWAFIIYICNIN
nr:MAG TPA: hypothetical protein [Caudoviricetes sp.]